MTNRQGGTRAPVAPPALLERYVPLIEGELRTVLSDRELLHYGLMRYHLGWEDAGGTSEGRVRGKLLRPLLCLASCEAVGGQAEQALPAAAALELLHNFSLIHDDIEDGSPQRHSRETVWRLWGIPLALNAGDGMFALARVALHRLSEVGLPIKQTLAVGMLLDRAALRLCEGQYLDLSYERRLDVSEDDYLRMVDGKTAALMAAAGASGALIGGAAPETVKRFEQFGRNMGFAFQIRDDILGIWGKSSETGKPTGEDIRARKKSLPVVHALQKGRPADVERLSAIYSQETMDDGSVREVLEALERAAAREHSQRTASEYAERALGYLSGLELVTDRRQGLEALAGYVVSREV